ncbi:MAG: sigma-70 family RNA polymerase sigma factor [Bacteroidales bacterium]|nr:sigma-70 family RNA polymerase sigma factor [Bacteroidales bacterium]
MKKRDKHIFSTLVHEHTNMLLTYIRATINDPATVDDIFQETMLVAWRRFEDYNPTRPLAAWLRGIARKLILSHYSDRKKAPITCHETVLKLLDERLSSIDRQPGDSWKDKVIALDACLETLSPAMRQCIELFYQDEHKTDDIAHTLKSTREAVKKRLQRARTLLADCLRRKGLFPTLASEASS